MRSAAVKVLLLGTLLLLAACKSSSTPTVSVRGPTQTHTYDGLVSSANGEEDARQKAIVLCRKNQGKSDATIRTVVRLPDSDPPVTQYGYSCV